MEDHGLLKMTAGKVDPEDLSTSEHKEVFQLIKVQKKTSPADLLNKTGNENTKQIIIQIASIDLGPAELRVQLEDHLVTLNKLKKNKKMKALKDDIQRALQKGDVETANRLTKEFEKLKKA